MSDGHHDDAQAFLTAAHAYAMAWVGYALSGGRMVYSNRQMIAEWQSLSAKERQARLEAACDAFNAFLDERLDQVQPRLQT